ncbi:MAG: hypothetical protein IPL73_24895 [Candidatus Obscuribacter sp.]|nr:hypothetical protein [Candidatus Obscuribacter sp.]
MTIGVLELVAETGKGCSVHQRESEYTARADQRGSALHKPGHGNHDQHTAAVPGDLSDVKDFELSPLGLPAA